MSHWARREFAARLGLETDHLSVTKGNVFPAIIARADVDPATRGMMAAISTSLVDGLGGVDKYQLKYWYRRQNGQSQLIHLFDIESTILEETQEIQIDEIYYRNKPLVGPLPPESQLRAREVLLDAFREINLLLREGGSPRELLKILYAYNIPQIVGEDIVLPGQNEAGQFSFKISDVFNPVAKGKITVGPDIELIQTIMQGEVNTLDDHRRIDASSRRSFATNKVTGVTFCGEFLQKNAANSHEYSVALRPVVTPDQTTARRMDHFLSLNWKKARSDEKESFALQAFRFLNSDITAQDVDTQIRVLGASYRILDLFRRRRYPMPLEIIHEFDLLSLFSPTEPPPPEGRMSVVSFLGNGKEETVEGFGFDLGACKAVLYEKPDESGSIKREIVILDLGKMLAPQGSDWDGALPDIIGILNDVVAITITHRHLDHMAAIVELTRLGLLKDKKIMGASRTLYILQNQLKAEVTDRRLFPRFETIQGEGILEFDNLSAEYCVDGIDHSTPSTIFRLVGKTDTGKIKGSYLFYGDGRRVDRKEFLSRGLRSFGLERQDTLFDLDITNAAKPGHCPTNAEATENRIDAWNCFDEFGILNAEISTNDRKLQELYRCCNRTGRNFTAVGHNIEMSLRAHNIHGVDPEYLQKHEKDNVNRFLQEDAKEESLKRTAHLLDRLKEEIDPEEKEAIEAEIQRLKLYPVLFRSRGSAEAKFWLNGDPGKVAILVTGTQGNAGEMFSTLSRFAEGWSTLDSERNTAYRIKNPKKWVAWIDQSAIPGNHKSQLALIHKLLRNRSLHAVCVAIDDGFKIYGLNQKDQEIFKKRYLTKDTRNSYTDETGALVITGAPIHPSGHGYREDIRDIVQIANADIQHGTHTNNPENTTYFHEDVCKRAGLRYAERQFNDMEYIEIDMGAAPEDAKIRSLGQAHNSIIVYKTIREFGKFFGGTIQAKRISKLDGLSGFDQYGLLGNAVNSTFENDIVAIDFAAASRRNERYPADKTKPDPSVMSEPLQERRYKGVELPRGVRLDERKRQQIKKLVVERICA